MSCKGFVENTGHDMHSPLAIAAASGNEEMVKFLIQEGADVNCSSDFGWTPLMQAARNGHSSVVLELLSNKADVTHSTKLGSSILSLAVASGNTATVAVVLNAVSERVGMLTMSDPLPLALAALHGNQPIASMLVEKGFSPDGPVPPSGMTPLMMAACNGHYAVVDWLVSKGANPHAISASCQTAFDIATNKGYGGIQMLLMKKMGVGNVTPLKGSSLWTYPGHQLLFENMCHPSSEEPCSEENSRPRPHCAKQKVPLHSVNCDFRINVSPCSPPSLNLYCQQQNALFLRPPFAGSHFSQQTSGTSSPCCMQLVSQCCCFSPHVHHQRLTDFLTPPVSRVCSGGSRGKENLRKLNRRMSLSDPEFLKKDEKGPIKWWKVATEKLHSKVKSKKRAFIKSRIVKTLKFGSETCKNDSGYNEECGHASGLLYEKRPQLCDNSAVSFSPFSKPLDVEHFLRNCNLEEYINIFAKQEVDLHTILCLTVEDLEEMGIVSSTEQAKILDSIAIAGRKQ